MYDLLHILWWYDNPVSMVITLYPEPRIRISCLFLDHSQRSPWRTPVLLTLSLLPVTQVENDHVQCDLLLRGSLWAEGPAARVGCTPRQKPSRDQWNLRKALLTLEG